MCQCDCRSSCSSYLRGRLRKKAQISNHTGACTAVAAMVTTQDPQVHTLSIQNQLVSVQHRITGMTPSCDLSDSLRGAIAVLAGVVQNGQRKGSADKRLHKRSETQV